MILEYDIIKRVWAHCSRGLYPTTNIIIVLGNKSRQTFGPLLSLCWINRHILQSYAMFMLECLMHLELLLLTGGWGALTTIKVKHMGTNIFTLIPPELQGGWCSSNAGCPEGVLLHGWCRGHGVMRLWVFSWQQLGLANTLYSLGLNEYENRLEHPAEIAVERSILSVTAPPHAPLLPQPNVLNWMFPRWKGHYSDKC